MYWTKTLALTVLLAPLCALADTTFLEPHEVALLKPAPEVEGMRNYTAANVDPTDYSKVTIGSITFFFAEDSKAKDIDAKEMTAITASLKSAMETRWARYYDIVEEPGPETLAVNLAVTGIKMNNKKRGLLGFTPIGLVVTTAGNLTGSRLVLTEASLQGETFDSLTGDVVTYFEVAKVESHEEKEKKRKKVPLTWEDVRLTLDDFADRAAKARFGE